MRAASMRVPLAAAAAVLIATTACTGAGAPQDVVTLAATHTLEDSGLLDSLAAGFRRAHPEHTLRVVVSGSGMALEQARRGDVDVVLSHAPTAEQRAVANGDVARRTELAYNQFLIAGPAADPAAVAAQSSASGAFAAIARANAAFVSRDDSSGTHLRELQLWRDARMPPPRGEHYIRSGGGMADALRIADQREAYVLTDPATFAIFEETLSLEPLLTDSAALRNTYAVMLVTRAPHAEAAAVLHEWLAGDDAAAIIRGFGDGLFTPVAPGRAQQ